jgi:hypothetical protein
LPQQAIDNRFAAGHARHGAFPHLLSSQVGTARRRGKGGGFGKVAWSEEAVCSDLLGGIGLAASPLLRDGFPPTRRLRGNDWYRRGCREAFRR